MKVITHRMDPLGFPPSPYYPGASYGKEGKDRLPVYQLLIEFRETNQRKQIGFKSKCGNEIKMWGRKNKTCTV